MRGLYFCIFCALFLAIFSFTLTNMAAAYIVSSLGGSTDIASYTITFYGLGNVISVPLGKPLSQRVGIGRLFPILLILFTFCSILCATAPNYALFLGCRFLQGFMAGPFYFMIQFVLNKITPPEKKENVTVIIITLFTLVPVLGACWGGWIAYDFVWQRSFFMGMPFILALAAGMHHNLKKVDLTLQKTPFDKVGFFFFFWGVLLLGFAVATAQEFDWYRSSRLIGSFSAGVLCFVFFLLWSWKYPYPILKLRLFKNWLLSYSLFNLAFLFSAYFGMVILLSLWLNLYANYTPDWIGGLIGAMAFAALFPMILIKKYSHLDPRLPLAISLFFFVISCFYTTIFSVEIDFHRILISRILAGLGLAFFLPPLFQICFNCCPPDDAYEVMSLFQITRILACSLGVAAYTTTWQRRQVFFHERLGEQLTPLSTETQQFFVKAKQFFNLAGKQAQAQLETFLDRQAHALALDDVFYAMAWILTVVLAILFLTFLIPSLNRWFIMIKIKTK
ncbi:MAG: MFS transporter [Verrucomicrobia bacterium]|nr:MFS transporter [Verrucomicrobiota bacterium]